MSAKYPSHPITASGESTLVPKGPWNYGLTVIGVHVRCDPEKLREAVPKPLEASSDGEVWFYIADIVSVSDSKPELNYEAPDLVQYYEATMFVKVVYEGKTYALCPFMYVDKDLPLMRGIVAGFPKKLAYISMTKLHPLLPAYSKPSENLVLGGFAVRSSYPLFKLKVKLESRVDKLPFDEFGEWLLPRYFPSIGELGGVAELVAFEPEYKRYGEIWRGSGEVEVYGGVNDEMKIFEPKEVLGGYYYTVAIKPRRLRLVAKMELE